MNPVQKSKLGLFEHDDAETIIGETHRHSVGVFFILFSATFMTLLIVVLATIFEKNRGTYIEDALGFDSSSTAPTYALVIFVLIMTLFIFLGTLAAVYVYKQNYLILTDQKLVLVRTVNIVHRKVSQLSIGDIQDISVNQPTLFSRMFNYGTIIIETSGEQANLQMRFITNPFEVNKSIVQSHEANMKKYGN